MYDERRQQGQFAVLKDEAKIRKKAEEAAGIGEVKKNAGVDLRTVDWGDLPSDSDEVSDSVAETTESEVEEVDDGRNVQITFTKKKSVTQANTREDDMAFLNSIQGHGGGSNNVVVVPTGNKRGVVAQKSGALYKSVDDHPDVVKLKEEVELAETALKKAGKPKKEEKKRELEKLKAQLETKIREAKRKQK